MAIPTADNDNSAMFRLGNGIWGWDMRQCGDLICRARYAGDAVSDTLPAKASPRLTLC